MAVGNANDHVILFRQGPSVNNGYLTTESPSDSNYTVDYATTGKNSRWVAVEGVHKYPDMRSNDQRALTYTTSPLGTDITITGYPLIHLWLMTDAPDLETFADTTSHRSLMATREA